MLKYVNFIILVVLAIFAGCNNPSGGSKIAQDHSPGLLPPGAFSFTQIRSQTTTANLRWSNSARVSSYTVFQGTTPTTITTVLPCSTVLTFCTVTGLTPGAQYFYKIVATNAAGSKDIAAIGTSQSVGLFDITGITPSDGAMNLTWSPSANATSYDILYGTRSGTYTATATNVTSPFNLTGLTNNVRYFFRVVAKNANNGYGLSDSEVNDTPFGPPPVPTGVSALAQPGNITLSWGASFGALSYSVYRGTTSGVLALHVSGLTSTTFVDTPTTDGQAYYYVVRAITPPYSSPDSLEVGAKSISNFNMTSAVAGPGTNQATISWPAVTGAETFDILYGTNPASLSSVAVNVTSPYALSGLVGGSTYYFRIRANNVIGDGTSRLSTNQLSATPVPLLPAPATFTVAATPGQVILNWSAVSGASSYEVLRGTVTGVYTSIASGLNTTTYTDTLVTNGTTYYYVVRANNGLPGANSIERSVKPIQSFSISSVSVVSSSSLQVSWGAAAGADSYNIQYGTTSGSYTSTVTNVTSPYNLTGLAANTTYYIVIRGQNSVGPGTSFTTAQSSGKTKTAAPSGLVATSTSGNVSLDWADTAGATSYRVYRGTVSGTYALLGTVGVSAYTDTTAANGTTYFYVVTADNGSESVNSSEVSARPINNFTLTSLTAPSPTSITVTWPAVTGAATYDVRYGTSAGTYTTTLTNRTSPLTISALTSNTAYYVIVVARNAVGTGTSSNSNELSVTTPAGPPSGVLATVGTGQITVSWNASPGASSYKVYRGTVSGTYALLQSGIITTNYVDNTVVAGTQYFYVVRAFNGSDSDNSAEVTGQAISPFSLTSVVPASTTSLTVTFPTTTGATAYDVRYGTTSGSYTTTVSGVTSPYTIIGLTSNVTYYVVARARNAIGSGASQTTAEISVKTPVVAPAGLAAASTPGQVVLTWGAVTGATSYRIYRGTTAGSTTLLQSGVATATFTDTPVTNGTTYYYAVTADNGSESVKSSEVATQPIAAHTISSLTTPSSTSMQVTWGAVTGATAYDVLYGTTSGTYTGSALNVTSPYTITALSPNTTYFVVVRAKNTIGAGTNTNSAESSRKTPTAAPVGLTASATSGQVGLNWTAVTGASSYNVYRGTVSGTLSLLASAVGSNAYMDTTAANGTTYFYTVSADNGSESAQSSEVSVRPISSFTLTALTPASSTSINLTWGAATGAATYDVRYGTTTGVYLGTVTNVTSPYTLTGLSPNTQYFIAIRANNTVGAGTSITSNELNGTTATAAPASLVATSSATANASLSWTAATGATNYRIYRGTVSGTYASIATGVTGTTYTDTTVTDGTTYFYVVRAFNGTESPNSNESSVQTISNFTISGTTAPTPNSIQVTWPVVTGATLYDVRYGTTSGSYTTTVANVTSPYTITGLASGTNYFVVVRARNAIGGSASNQSAEVSQITPIGPPTGLAATANPGSVSLTWTAAGGASSYKVYRGTTSGTYALLASGVATTSYTDTTVANGTTYFYVVKSFNGADSADSNEATILPMAAPVISAITAPSSSSIQVIWGAVSGAASYDVRYGTATGTYSTTVAGVTSPYTITGLTPNTTYYVVVRANNIVGSGTSSTSAESSLKTPTSAPVGLTATANPGQVGLNWTAVTGATTYRVYRGTVSGTLALLASGVATNAYLDTTSVNGTTYFYTVSADNGSESAQSSEVSVRPIGTFSISALTAQSSTTISVTWGAATGAASYDVRYGTSTGVYLGTITNVTSPYTITALSPDTQYFVVVRANNAVGAGTSLQTSELNAKTATAAPTALLASATTSQIGLSWTAAAGATNYRIYRGTVSGTYAQIAAGVTGTTFSDTTAANGTQYFYVVRAFNGTESPDSNEVTGKAIASFTIASTSAPSSTSIQVSWGAVSGGDTFDVKYGTATGTYTTTVANVTSPYTITALSGNTTYYIVLVAKNTIGSGNSVQTAEVSQITPTAAPAGLAATATPGSVALSWTAVTGASSYNVYRSTISGSYGAALATGVATNSYTDTTVANGTQYYYTVTAVNGSESSKSSEVTIQPIASFAITSAIAQSSTSIEVTWPAVTGATAYDIKYGTVAGTYTTTLSNQASPTLISGLTSGSTYYFVVVAKNAIGTGTSFQSAEVSSTTSFGAPSGLTATASPASVALTWGAVSGATQYKVYRSLTSASYGAAMATIATNSYTDATAANGTTYFYVVTAFNGSDSAFSNEVSVQPISSFTLSSATATSASTINIAWTAATGATSYDVRYGTATGSYTTTLVNQTSPLTITGLSANTTYYINVQAKNAVGTGTTVNSGELNAKTATAAPSGLTATATTSQIALSWTAATGATTYNVYRSTTSGTYGAALATAIATTTYTDSTAVNGTQYYYVVRATNGLESAASNEATGQPISSFAISGTTAPSTTSIQVTWGAATGATAYDVRYGSSTGSYTTTVSSVTSPYTITGLTSGTTYYIVVRARNIIGSGASVQTSEASQITPIAAPAGLAATATTGSIALSWSAVAGATSYKVYRSTTTGSYGAALATGVGTNSYTDNTAANGTQYYYVVKSFNGADSANSLEVTATPIANFTITLSSATSTSMQVSWTNPAGGATYDVRYGTATGSYTSTVLNQTSPYTITGLTPNTTYYVVVRANNAIGSGTSTTSSEASQKTATGAPTGLAATASPGASVALSWTAVTGATDYTIYRGTVSGTLTQIATGNVATSYNDTLLTNGTTYFYAVAANNGSLSPQSTEVAVRPISTFSFSSATAASSTSINLVWTAATGADSYDVEYGTSTATYTATAASVTSPYSLTGLTANTTYFIRVKAKNAIGAGTSVNSSELNAKTATAAPTSLVASSSAAGQISLSWTAATGATSYSVYRSTTTGVYGAALATGVAGTTYTDSAVTDGTTYFYVVRATNGTESANSNEGSARSIASFAISSTTAPSTTSIQVSWPAAAGAASYDVRYGTSTGSYTTTISNVTSSYTITGLTSATTYYVVVRANNAIGGGASIQTAEVSQVTPLGAPTGLVATASTGSVSLTWNAVAGASSYKVYRSTTTGTYGAALATGVGTNSYTDNTVTNGTQYFYVVKAFNGADSADSNEVTAQPIANFSITLTHISATSIQVAWTNPTGGATYDVRYGTATGSYSTTVAGQTSPYTITGLSSNTTYYIVVRANNAVGTGTSTTSSESTLKTATGAPTGLVANGSPASVGLTWSAVTGASTYSVYRGTVSGTLALLASAVATASYTDNTAVDGTTYYYAVTATNGNESARSTEVAVQTISSFSLTAATPASSTSINLTWGVATGATSYTVRYGTSTGVYLTSVSGVTSAYTLTGLTAGTRYYISIRASNAVGAGTNFDSNEMNALTAVGGPTGLAAVASPASVALSWTAVSGATNYNVYRGTVSGTYTQIASAIVPNSYTDTTALNGTVYFYVVRAFNGIESANSNEVSVKPISAFTLAAATVNSSSAITLSWGAATGADAYDIQYGTTAGTYTTTVPGVTSAYQVTGLSAATLYYFVVRARNAQGAGTSILSNEVSGRTATAAPTTLAATSTNGSATLTWVAASGATNYNIYRSTTSGTYGAALATGVTATNYTDSSITNGTIYYYVVRSNNGIESGNSNEATASTIGAFAISSTSATTNTIQVNWGAATNATAYDVKYGTTSGSYSTTVSGVTSPYTITALASNTTYFIQVTARNAGSTMVYNSAEASRITALAPPVGLVAVGSNAQVSLSWTAVTGASSYKVYRGTTTGVLTELAAGIVATTYSDTTPLNGTTYFYAVLSFNGTDSALSSEVSKQPIATPVISSVTGNSSTSIAVTWGAATGAASYDLQWGTATGTYTTTIVGVTSPYSITGLTAGTTYYVRVQAKNAVGGGTTVNSAEASGTPNSPPVLSSIAAQTMDADTSLPVNFTLSDSNHVLTCAGSMSGSSTNTTLLPNANIVFSGTMPNCTATLTPAASQTGTSTVTLTASDGISSTSQSFTLTVNPCTVASIVWETQPTGMAAGALFGTAPRVSLRKADNTLCTSNTAPVALVVTTDTTEQQDAAITGTASVIPSGGYALFSAASMQRAGTGFTVAASQGLSLSLNSNTFNVTAGAASKLVYYQQPLTNDPSTNMIPAPSVRTADTFGNYVAVSGISVAMSLQDNTEGATLSGTATVSTNASGIASFTGLSINLLGTYFLSATPSNGWAVVNSDFFDIIVINPQNFTIITDMLTSAFTGTTGNASFDRTGTIMGTNYMDGLNTCTWKIVAYNTGQQNSDVFLKLGTTDIATIAVSKNLGATPTSLSTTFLCSNFNASANWGLRTFKSATILSSQLIIKQIGAKRTQVFFPLVSIEDANIDGGVTTTSTTPVAISGINFPTYNWDSLEWNNLNEVVFSVSGKTTLGSFCGALFNKTTNAQIGGEVCSTSTAEISLYQSIPRSSMPATGELEARVRNTSGGTATIYKAGVYLRLVNIVKAKSIQRIAAAKTLTASDNFVGQRVKSYLTDFGGIKTEKLECRAKVTASAGVGTFVMKDAAATQTSGTTFLGNVTGSTINYSNPATFTSFENIVGPTTNGRFLIMNYTYSSGSLDLSHCIYSTNVAY